MKKILLLFLVCLVAISPAFAKRDETVTLKVGQQTTTKLGKLAIRFVTVDSDSRCPINARCIWAGNARVKISVSKGRRAWRSFDLNSMLEPKVAVYDGYEIGFVDLTPHPGEKPGRPRLKLSIRKAG